MTADAVSMGLNTDQGVIVTARCATGGTDNGHQSVVFRYDRMDRIPNAAVTGGTGTAGDMTVHTRDTRFATIKIDPVAYLAAFQAVGQRNGTVEIR